MKREIIQRISECLPAKRFRGMTRIMAGGPKEVSLGWQQSRLVLSIQPVEGLVSGFLSKYGEHTTAMKTT